MKCGIHTHTRRYARVDFKRRAFTLIELLVVIAIIGLMSTIAVVSLNSSRVNARNTARKANLVQISKALEVYYSDNGGYPSTGGSASWNGVCSTYGSKPDTGAGAWIPNLSPNYMATLPHDPNTKQPSMCYLYTSDGTDYKILAYGLAEIPRGSDMIDPIRTDSYAIYTPAAHSW